ncbi:MULTISPECIES: suppressor of fused domain protein [Chryseobacterium]|uniref:Suppressor of fused-like domain-containing protein n=1 Tax=Chryseobacterium camelliae TaxID=1265445 RepID=A0ABU0TKW0_9FLAO|nr:MULTISPECIES: suppressor of fused domain protein [Chryseobacterium]MDT3408475.1 hypothetical protein [Pseudacidovorax intermedius]MDQ1097669.1 hypothetical protein [Chryseobacterium camelliae]MDQ1101598.1 hypothetical protein [Chryseobacterium sp. SORGH_AS_1048]MDR6085041.1 hypothetical protein [Chryseobacterium sp. SORGH_AS_0909]MDR6129396.1 hypothetical protein [Chryseobacterium sp. SORGH_AS_1175]
MELIKHIEKYLGVITKGESISHEKDQKFLFAKFRDLPIENVTTYTSLGLSNHVLAIKDDKNVRIEILFSIYTEQESERVTDLLFYVANKIIDKHKFPLRGQIIDIPESILEDSSLTSLYVSIPVFFDENFAVLKGTNPDTVFAWLFPIYKEEKDFIVKHGWSKFEDILENGECDFWDLNRENIDL